MAQLCARAMYAMRPSFHFNSAISGVGDYFSLDGKNSLASLSVPASQLSSCVSDVQKKLRAEGMRLSMVRVREMEGDGGALRQNLPVRGPFAPASPVSDAARTVNVAPNLQT
jgi:hypothetical protein